MARPIPPPREDFIDPRTRKIAISWFRYLIKEQGHVDELELQNALTAVYGVAAAAEATQKADEASLLASLPVPSQDFTPQIEEAKLMSLREPSQDFTQNIQDARLERMRDVSEIAELEKRVDDVAFLASLPKPDTQVSASRIAGRVLLRC